MNVFEFVKSINQTKPNLIRTADDPTATEAKYVPFIVNRSLSYFVDTVLIANEINQHANLPKIMQYEFLLNTVRPGKRFSKWHKGDNSRLELIQQYYSCSLSKAAEIDKILTDEQYQVIQEKIDRQANATVQ